MLIIGFASLLLIALTSVIHYEVLRVMYGALPTITIPKRTKLLAVIFGVFVAHVLEIVVYGGALYVLAQFPALGKLSGPISFSFEDCLYFSAETYTSLGVGDITPVGPLRLLVGVEALNGLLLIGWSASFAYIAMERFWSADDENSRP